MMDLSRVSGFQELEKHYDRMCGQYLDASKAYTDAKTTERRNLTRWQNYLHKEIVKAAWVEKYRPKP